MKWNSYVYVFFVSLILSATLIPVILAISHKKKWYDFADKRKIHDGNIPRLGGVGIFLGFLISSIIILFFVMEKNYIETNFWKIILIFVSCLMIHIIGLLDDFFNLRARYKMIGQVIISIIMVQFGFHFNEVVIPFTTIIIENIIICKFISFLWIVGITNAINLIDGIDGLSSVVAFIAAFFFMAINWIHDDYLTVFLSMAVMGSIGGFFIYNKPKAKIFMGDSGSIFIGFLLAILPLVRILPSEQFVLESSVTILMIPISDTLFAMTRRTLSGKKFSCPDKEHLHHILLDFGNSNWTILKGIGSVAFAFGVYPFALYVQTKAIPAKEVIGCNVIWFLAFWFLFSLHRKWKLKFRKTDISGEPL